MLGFPQFRRRSAWIAIGTALMLTACSDYGELPKHLKPLPASLKHAMEKKGMDQRGAILVRLFKEESELEVWKQVKGTGRYDLLKTYEICAWSGVLGPKIKEGDRQAPEGFYTIRPAQMNAKSDYYLAFNMGYPNEYDRALGRTGSELMVHGACSSRGCYSMTDENIGEIYTLGRLAFEGGQRDFQVQAFPFRMTAENMARHRDDLNIPFWRMLKEGSDHFEMVRQPPKVDVCEKRYVFNTVPQDGTTYTAAAACPPMSVPESIRIAVAAKQERDDKDIVALAARFDEREGRQPGSSIVEREIALALAQREAAPMSTAAVPVALETASTEVPPKAVAADVAAVQPGSAAPTVEATASVAMAPTGPAAVHAAMSAPLSKDDLRPSFLPVPEVQEPETAAAAPEDAPKPPSATDAATLAERMQAESTDAGMATAYAPDEKSQEGGLTGFISGLFQ